MGFLIFFFPIPGQKSFRLTLKQSCFKILNSSQPLSLSLFLETPSSTLQLS
ncbi:hypothetical protein HanXRQr2_Chr16g0775331 [Helianthus annuus]|uniref:Uncharacterized protein n=1 Tax=Helianthus annuus TaxID=4232 RepID=A0A9K3DXA0_HELAN|nr:hypothetical protein HanXRQr2_Chr16g0775331 [Helianthus annuus]